VPLTCHRQQDITVLPPDPAQAPGPEPWSFADLTFVSWIHVARIQGRAYEELYSPAGLRQPDQVRRARVKAMADEVMAVMQRSEDMNVRVNSPKPVGRDHHDHMTRRGLASGPPHTFLSSCPASPFPSKVYVQDF